MKKTLTSGVLAIAMTASSLVAPQIFTAPIAVAQEGGAQQDSTPNFESITDNNERIFTHMLYHAVQAGASNLKQVKKQKGENFEAYAAENINPDLAAAKEAVKSNNPQLAQQKYATIVGKIERLLENDPAAKGVKPEPEVVKSVVAFLKENKEAIANAARKDSGSDEQHQQILLGLTQALQKAAEAEEDPRIQQLKDQLAEATKRAETAEAEVENKKAELAAAKAKAEEAKKAAEQQKQEANAQLARVLQTGKEAIALKERELQAEKDKAAQEKAEAEAKEQEAKRALLEAQKAHEKAVKEGNKAKAAELADAEKKLAAVALAATAKLANAQAQGAAAVNEKQAALDAEKAKVKEAQARAEAAEKANENWQKVVAAAAADLKRAERLSLIAETEHAKRVKELEDQNAKLVADPQGREALKQANAKLTEKTAELTKAKKDLSAAEEKLAQETAKANTSAAELQKVQQEKAAAEKAKQDAEAAKKEAERELTALKARLNAPADTQKPEKTEKTEEPAAQPAGSDIKSVFSNPAFLAVLGLGAVAAIIAAVYQPLKAFLASRGIRI